MARTSLTYNTHDGSLEAIVHGYRNGFIRAEEYNNLTQCDSLSDVKSQLQTTDYGNFLQNDGVLTSRVIADRATERLAADFRELRGWSDNPLSRFLDFITYDYMISNVLKLIAAARHDSAGGLDILYRCHPLGLFDGIAALTATSSVDEMFETVLIDSPIGIFFDASAHRSFDSQSIEYIRAVLQKNYLEAFYDFVLELGGATAEVMGRALSFEADRLVLGVTVNTCNMKDLLPEDRKKLFPNFGSLTDVHEELCTITDPSQIPDRLKMSFPEFAELFDDGRGVDTTKKSVEKKLAERSIAVYRDCMSVQFQYGVFYGWIKLKEAEIGNIMWIAECITQNMKKRITEYTPVV